MRICCVVRNSVIRDARVLKEAASLKEAGHEVDIIGLQEADINDPYEVLENGVNIYRLPWKTEAYSDISRLSLLAGSILVLFLFTCIFLIDTPVWTWQLLVIILTVLIFLLQIPGKFRSMSQRYSKQEVFSDQEKRNKSPVLIESARKISIFSLVMRVYAVHSCQKPMYRFISSRSYDVIHCHDIGTLPLGAKLKKKEGAKLVYDAHEYYEGTTGIPEVLKWVYKVIHHSNARWIDRFIVVNQSIGNLYKEHFPSMPEPDVIMNASAIPDKQVYDGRLHKASGIPDHRDIVLFQGGFTSNRGLTQLVLSAAHYPDHIHLVLMGWGHMEAKLKSLAKKINYESGCENRVVFVEPVSNSELSLWTCGAAAGAILYEDAGVNHRFCTPNKLWEYPAAGVPVLITPRVEMLKMVDKYHYGIVSEEPLSPKVIALNLEHLINDHDKYQNACKKFIEESNWSVFSRKLQDLYTELFL